MKIKEEAFEDEHGFFCLCDGCGSKTWYESETEVNSLEEDGTQLIKKKIQEFVAFRNYKEYPRCYDCEKKVSIISFKTIPRNERKKVFKMSAAERKQWVINLKIVKTLEKEDWKEEHYIK
jgi:hypothetical protein